MAAYFLDTSALAKHYHQETGSALVDELILRPEASILISRLTVVELQSVFAGKVRSGAISTNQAAVFRHRFIEEAAKRVFAVVALTGEHYDVAAALIERHGASDGLRTLDSLQLAVALTLHRDGAADHLVAADKVLCKVAAAERVPVIDTTSPAA